MIFSTFLAFSVFTSHADNIIWKRHVLTEPRRDGRTLLLVVDESAQGGVLPRIVRRESFAAGEFQELKAAMSSAPGAETLARPLTVTNNPIWPIDHAWTDQDETDYSTWINKIADPNFLVGGGVDVDCADYGITLRWIYAHDHHLPAGDQLAAGGTLFGSWQSTTDWDKLSINADWRKDDRFKAALRYVLNATFTHSLLTDLYPVKIVPDYVNPGTIFLTISGDTGHTRTIYSIGQGGACDQGASCISIIWGNEPASENGWVTPFVPAHVTPAEGGFLRFRWPEQDATGAWQLRAPEQMRGYSVEQYSWDESNYLTNVANGIGLWSTPEERYSVVAGGVINLLYMRLSITMRGQMMCSIVPCQPGDPYDVEFSTPNRDRTLLAAIHGFQTVAAQTDLNNPDVANFIREYSVPMFPGSPYTIMDILTGDLAAKFVSDPRVDFFARWGVSAVSAEDRLRMDIGSLGYNWAVREHLVHQAQDLCFPGGVSAPVCDPASAAARKLSTDRLDQAFRITQGQFTAALAGVSEDIKQEVAQELQGAGTGEKYCSSSGDQQCTLYDYVFGTQWAAMKSNADAPRKARYGF